MGCQIHPRTGESLNNPAVWAGKRGGPGRAVPAAAQVRAEAPGRKHWRSGGVGHLQARTWPSGASRTEAQWGGAAGPGASTEQNRSHVKRKPEKSGQGNRVRKSQKARCPPPHPRYTYTHTHAHTEKQRKQEFCAFRKATPNHIFF